MAKPHLVEGEWISVLRSGGHSTHGLSEDTMNVPAMVEWSIEYPVDGSVLILIDVIVSIFFNPFPPTKTDALGPSQIAK